MLSFLSGGYCVDIVECRNSLSGYDGCISSQWYGLKDIWWCPAPAINPEASLLVALQSQPNLVISPQRLSQNWCCLLQAFCSNWHHCNSHCLSVPKDVCLLWPFSSHSFTNNGHCTLQSSFSTTSATAHIVPSLYWCIYPTISWSLLIPWRVAYCLPSKYRPAVVQIRKLV